MNIEEKDKPIYISDLPEFDMADQLRNDKDIALYLNLVLEDGDSQELIRALGHVARAKGMSLIASKTGLGRESLYKALKPGAQPRFDTILKVINALGMSLQTKPNTP